MLVRIRVGFLAVASCLALASCARPAERPQPTGTLEPSIVQSSARPTIDKNNVACTLLTSEERESLVGYTLDAEVPVRPDPGTEECVWVRSLREPARSALRVITLSTLNWAKLVIPQMRAAATSPNVDRKLRLQLKEALEELLAKGDDLPTEEACNAYLLLAESRGSQRPSDEVFYSNIGGMPAGFATSCDDGVMTMVGYGEYGVRPSLALNHGLGRLTEQAGVRAAEAFAEGATDEGTDGEVGDQSPSPEPSPTETDESAAEDEGDS